MKHARKKSRNQGGTPEKPLPSGAFKHFPEQLGNALHRAREEFLDIFGRAPRSNDPVLVSQKYDYPSIKVEQETLDALEAIGATDLIKFIYLETGRLLTEEGYANLTIEEREEVEHAHIKFEQLVKENPDFRVRSTDIGKSMRRTIYHAQIILSYFAERYPSNRRVKVSNIELLTMFSALAIAKTLRSIRILLEAGASLDSSALLRSMYEVLFTISYSFRNPGHADVASGSLGVMQKTHEFDTNKRGEKVLNRIRNISTGTIHEIPSRWGLASNLGPEFMLLYKSHYQRHSELVHNDVAILKHSTSDRGLTLLDADIEAEVLMECLLVVSIFCIDLIEFSHCNKRLTKDITRLIDKMVAEIFVMYQFCIETKSTIISPDYDKIFRRLVLQRLKGSRFYPRSVTTPDTSSKTPE